jgi:hypothetical protein
MRVVAVVRCKRNANARKAGVAEWQTQRTQNPPLATA